MRREPADLKSKNMRHSFPAVFKLSSLNGTNGFIINGPEIGAYAGYSVAPAGDVNGDGVDDVIIGAPYFNSYAGRAYVLFGSKNITANGTVINLADLKSAQGFAIVSEGPDEQIGYFVNRIGDINGDHRDDLIIGNYLANSIAGRCYILFGSPTLGLNGKVFLANLDSTTGFRINGENAYDYTCISAELAGDINGDNITDFIIGAPHIHPDFPGLGKSYVVFGNRTLGLDGDINLADLGNKGFTLYGVSNYDETGYFVSASHDFNHDGYDDLIIGAPQSETKPVSSAHLGITYIVYANPSIGLTGRFDLSQVNGTNGFMMKGIHTKDYFGYALNSLGDVNQDGKDDFIIGSYGASRAYVFFGGIPLTTEKVFNLTKLNGTNGFIIEGLSDSATAYSVSSAGDINDDGIDDILVGIPGRGAGVIYGAKKLGANGIIDVSKLNGIDGFQIEGPCWDCGLAVNVAGDLNDDGISDIIIGAPTAVANNQTNAGQAYVIFGRAMPPELDFCQLTVHQNQSLPVTTNDIMATGYARSGSLLLTASNIENGYFSFEDTSTTEKPLATSFQWYLNNETDGTLWFHPVGHDVAAFNISVNNGRASTTPVPCHLTFIPTPPTPSPLHHHVSPLMMLTWLAVAVGGTAVALVSARVGMNVLAKKRFNQVFQDFNSDEDTLEIVRHRDDVLRPIAKHILGTIQVTNFLGYVNQETMRGYVDAIESVLVIVKQLDPTFDRHFEACSEEESKEMTANIVDQIKDVLSLSSSCGSRCNFFKPRVAPSVIQRHAQEIAEAITQRQPLMAVEVNDYSIQPGV